MDDTGLSVLIGRKEPNGYVAIHRGLDSKGSDLSIEGDGYQHLVVGIRIDGTVQERIERSLKLQTSAIMFFMLSTKSPCLRSSNEFELSSSFNA